MLKGGVTGGFWQRFAIQPFEIGKIIEN